MDALAQDFAPPGESSGVALARGIVIRSAITHEIVTFASERPAKRRLTTSEGSGTLARSRGIGVLKNPADGQIIRIEPAAKKAASSSNASTFVVPRKPTGARITIRSPKALAPTEKANAPAKESRSIAQRLKAEAPVFVRRDTVCHGAGLPRRDLIKRVLDGLAQGAHLDKTDYLELRAEDEQLAETIKKLASLLQKSAGAPQPAQTDSTESSGGERCPSSFFDELEDYEE